MLLHATETWPIDGGRHNGLLWKEEHPLLKEEVVQNRSLLIKGGLELGEMDTESGKEEKSGHLEDASEYLEEKEVKSLPTSDCTELKNKTNSLQEKVISQEETSTVLTKPDLKQENILVGHFVIILKYLADHF